MGVYNIYGNVQLKVADDLTLKTFEIGDKVDIPDGAYVGYEGVVIVIDGKLSRVFPGLFDKYGGEYDLLQIVTNPLKGIVNSFSPLHEKGEKNELD